MVAIHRDLCHDQTCEREESVHPGVRSMLTLEFLERSIAEFTARKPLVKLNPDVPRKIVKPATTSRCCKLFIAIHFRTDLAAKKT
jgi:hypothetical protein